MKESINEKKTDPISSIKPPKYDGYGDNSRSHSESPVVRITKNEKFETR